MIENHILGRDGLTITSANHLANIAKEMYEALEAKIEGLKFHSKDFTLAINGQSYRVENESDKEELETISDSLSKIGELKAFIAYLREGIKAKMSLDRDDAFEEHVNQLVKEGRTDLERPTAKPDLSFEDELLKLTTEQRARYYGLEAKCATIGSYIHPEGAFAEARKAFFEHRKNPTQVEGKGQEAEICTYTTLFTAEDIDGKFFDLQTEYRNIQAEFNRMKAEIDQRVSETNNAFASEALSTLELWTSARNVERKLYNDRVKALKVVIPQNLRQTYEMVNKVASGHCA